MYRSISLSKLQWSVYRLIQRKSGKSEYQNIYLNLLKCKLQTLRKLRTWGESPLSLTPFPPLSSDLLIHAKNCLLEVMYCKVIIKFYSNKFQRDKAFVPQNFVWYHSLCRLHWADNLICIGKDDPARKSIKAAFMVEKEDWADPAWGGTMFWQSSNQVRLADLCHFR